jgi:hypothetical protein
VTGRSPLPTYAMDALEAVTLGIPDAVVARGLEHKRRGSIRWGPDGEVTHAAHVVPRPLGTQEAKRQDGMELDRVRRDAGLSVLEVKERDAGHVRPLAEPHRTPGLRHLPASQPRCPRGTARQRRLRDHVMAGAVAGRGGSRRPLRAARVSPWR